MLSRRRIVLVTVALLLALDLGRSIYARLAAATPATQCSPDPSYATPITWPPGAQLDAHAPLGEHVYAQHCAICHGAAGRGNGPASPSLQPRPRDFSRGVFKLKSTPDNQPPTLADVRATIRRGMPGSSMPAWNDVLTPEEIDAVADYIRRFGPHTAWAPAAARPHVSADALAAASLDRGRALFEDSGCASCHGADGHGHGKSAAQLKDVWGRLDPPRDLTAPWTFRGGSDPDALSARITYGINGTPMPSYGDVLGADEIVALIAYVRSLARPRPWEAGGTLSGPGQSIDPVERGRYLVRAGMCGLCHTPVDAHGIYCADTHYLAGGMKITAGAHGVFFASNLTPDVDTGLGKWTVDEIATAIRTGHTPGRRLNFWGMPWMVLGALTETDASAIAAYLKTLPPVHNQMPMPLHYGFVETVARKLGYAWPALVPERLAYYAGNFGSSTPTRFTRTFPQRLLIWAQYAVLVMGFCAYLVARPTRRAGRERSRGLGWVMLLLLVTLGGGSAVVYRYPALDTLPTQAVVTAFNSVIPPVATKGLAAEQATLLRRGRYLYGIASCAYCHGGSGAGGGKVNWSVFGTTWARNLTAHPTGLAAWSDAALLRAMISGVNRDGRPLHWQAMIWDHLSNYSIEDQHALLAYLRSLPPVDHAWPPPAPPGATDCAGDTFWVGTTNGTIGCQ